MTVAITTYGRFQRASYGRQHEARSGQLAFQGGRCALCAVEFGGHNYVVDHCHATGRLRGLLCLSCNNAMAAVDRGNEWLERAKRYRDCGGAWMPVEGAV